MTGLNLERFLYLLRADLGAWLTLGLIALLIALMVWTSWGSRRALRKCLALSVIAHFALLLYGETRTRFLLLSHTKDAPRAERIHQIKVVPAAETANPTDAQGRAFGPTSRWDRPVSGLALADSRLSAPKNAEAPAVPVRPADRPDLEPLTSAAPETSAPALDAPESRPDAPPPAEASATPPSVTPGPEDDVAPAVVAPRPDPEPATTTPDRRLRPERVAPAPPPPAPAGPRRPSSSLTILPPVDSSPTSPVEPLASAPNETKPVLNTGEPVPPASTAEAGPDDVAAAEVIPARPDPSRWKLGERNLRAGSRPGSGAIASNLPRPGRPQNLAPTVPPLEMATEAPTETKTPRVRPDTSRSINAGEPRPPAPGEDVGDVAVAEVVKEPSTPLPRVATPDPDIRRRSRPSAVPTILSDPDRSRSRPNPAPPLSLARVTPGGVPALPEIRGATGGRPLADVPEVYRSRLDPNRSALAYRAGASPASEQAVERALDWLARHQDIDGRWDGGTFKDPDGSPTQGDDNFTVHCPAGETCFGECAYGEADTALTGLALLSFLGAGYTQTDGKYARTVSGGLDYLLAAQKGNGDLRGQSRAVGMYCHAMATIALCEAYALTGEERLRKPVERAVDFLVRSRAKDGLVWRYAPGAASGDTSILGWVVMVLKSAREVGINVPETTRTGVVTWLSRIASGDAKGLGRYQIASPVTPTMTAEAWACRQFLGVGGPGPASNEAARYLLAHGPKSDPYNLYYWYYGTLAMYQNGGDAWYQWNSQARDEITRRQVVSGHSAGSWAPDDSLYGSLGGRIYCTALATLSLEVYYRYLRLYDAPTIPPAIAPRPRNIERDRTLGRGSPTESPKR